MKNIGNCVVTVLYVAILIITWGLLIRFKFFTFYEAGLIFLGEAMFFALISISFEKLRNNFRHHSANDGPANTLSNQVEETENGPKYVS